MFNCLTIFFNPTIFRNYHFLFYTCNEAWLLNYHRLIMSSCIFKNVKKLRPYPYIIFSHMLRFKLALHICGLNWEYCRDFALSVRSMDHTSSTVGISCMMKLFISYVFLIIKPHDLCLNEAFDFMAISST